MGINTESVKSHYQFSQYIAPDVTFLSDSSGEYSKAYGINILAMERGYFVIDSDRKLHFQYVANGTLLQNQTGTLLMEADIMTGNYTGNPDDYTSGGLLKTHEDDGNDVGNHAYDFGLQAQCGSNLTLYNQLELSENGAVLVFFGGPNADDAVDIFSDLKTNINQFQERGMALIALDDKTPSKNMDFAESMDIEGREIVIFYDKHGRTGDDYGVYVGSGWYNVGHHETAYFILDKTGVIQYKHTGSMLENQTETLIDEIDRRMF